MTFPAPLIERAAKAAELLVARGEKLGVSESAAGGLIAASLLAIPGASAYFLGGTVIYTMESRAALFASAPPPPDRMRGATEAFARYQAEAARHLYEGATWGVGETGAAGPANPYGDPAGHAWVAVSGPTEAARHVETGLDNRPANMIEFTAAALDLLNETLAG